MASPDLDQLSTWEGLNRSFDPNTCDLQFQEGQAAVRPEYFGVQVQKLWEDQQQVRNQYRPRLPTSHDGTDNDTNTQPPAQRPRLNQE